MSYNIAIVNFRLPEDFDEACKIVDELADIEVDEIEMIFKQFHDEATKVYPCLCDLSDDEVDDGVWCDGPLIDNFRVKAPVIGFSYSKVEEAFPVVGNLALKMGLSILDWQSGKVYNP
jgi:hypothetical protein